MILLCKLAAAVLVAAVLTLLLKKDQPAFALLVSVCTAAGLLAVAMRQIEPLLAWLRTLEVYFQGQSPALLLRALGIALVAQFAADTCREAGLCAASIRTDERALSTVTIGHFNSIKVQLEPTKNPLLCRCRVISIP